MAFSKKMVEDRKAWLSNFVPGTFLDQRAPRIPYKDFIHKARRGQALQSLRRNLTGAAGPGTSQRSHCWLAISLQCAALMKLLRARAPPTWLCLCCCLTLNASRLCCSYAVPLQCCNASNHTCNRPQELILFSRADLERSIPSMVDGFKPGQRKIMFACFKRNLKKDIKVQLSC